MYRKRFKGGVLRWVDKQNNELVNVVSQNKIKYSAQTNSERKRNQFTKKNKKTIILLQLYICRSYGNSLFLFHFVFNF